MIKPSARETAQRLVILKAQVVHAISTPPPGILSHRAMSKEEQRQVNQACRKLSDQFIQAMKSQRLWNAMTGEEKEFLASVPPRVNLQQHINATWRIEAVAALMWALRMIPDFPPFDRQTDHYMLRLIPDEDPRQFFERAALLPEEEIERKRSLAELWHWRSRTRQIDEEKRPLPPKLGFSSYDEIVRKVAGEAARKGELAGLIEEDFAAKGKAYRDLSAEEWSEVRSITVERHRALNWLCGYAPANRWDRTPTET